MNKMIYTITIAMCFALIALPAAAATKVFLLAGQSNMAGLGGYEGDDPYIPSVPADKPCPAPYDKPQTAVHLWSDQTGGQWVNVQPGYGFHWTPGGKTFGPEVGFGYALHQAFPNDNIYLIKLGASSTNLAVDWNPNGAPSNYYHAFKNLVTNAMQSISGLSPQYAGMVWMQGESDCDKNNPNATAHSAAYAANLTNLINEARNDFGGLTMPFVLGRITTYWGSAANNALVRTAQETVPGVVGNAAWIDTDDLPWAYVGHYGTDGQITLGTRFASKFVQTPEPSSLLLTLSGLLCAILYVRPILRNRITRDIALAGIATFLATVAPAVARSEPPVIVAFGDSTTAPRGELVVYSTLIEQGLAAKGIPTKLVNAGVPGNTTLDAAKRFETDVLAKKPRVAIIQFGINDSAVDVWKSPAATSSRVSLADYKKNLLHFIRTLKTGGVDVILMTPNPLRWTKEMRDLYGKAPYRPDEPDGFNVVLARYADATRETAKQQGVGLIDVYQAFQAYGEKSGQSIDDLLLDGVHPNEKGQQLVAELILSSGLLDKGRNHDSAGSSN